LLAVVGVLAVVAGVRWLPGLRLALTGDLGQSGAWRASGVIAADETALASSRGGRITTIAVAEGESVKAGQTLVTLDATLLEGQIEVAQSQVEVAEASLRQVEAGARPGAVALAQAQLQQAQAAHDLAQQALADAQTLRDNPQQLDMEVALGEARVAAAEARLKSAVALKDEAEAAKNALHYGLDVLKGWNLPFPPPAIPSELQSADNDWWRAWVGVNAASATLDDAKAKLAHWRSVRANPQALNAQVGAAKAGVEQAAAAVDAAQAQLDATRAGASAEQRTAARARVAQAQAVLDALTAQRAELQILAPVDGTVLSLAAQPGEIAAPGSTLLSLANLAELRLAVYVAENWLGSVALQQVVQVEVDAFSGRAFEGRITHIADHPQYTPRNVATKDERVNTVYAVEIRLANAEGLLKPGMPADALLSP
jgi:HlyD family secretion protein